MQNNVNLFLVYVESFSCTRCESRTIEMSLHVVSPTYSVVRLALYRVALVLP